MKQANQTRKDGFIPVSGIGLENPGLTFALGSI